MILRHKAAHKPRTLPSDWSWPAAQTPLIGLFQCQELSCTVIGGNEGTLRLDWLVNVCLDSARGCADS